jgi:glycosyltransferase involved in cell wall biosynthesis
MFPSLYEGFGLPLLEAMQLGVPALASRVSSLPEVGGDAVCYVDPYDVASIAAGLKRLDDGDDLRAELGRRGLEQAQKFSNERYRERLSLLYERALQGAR